MRRFVTTMLALALLAGTARAGDDPGPETTPEQAYYRAFYREKGLRDFAAAETEYEAAAAAAEAAEKRDLRVQCLLGRARCLATLGRADDAKAVLGRVLELDPDNAAAKRGLAAKPAEGGDLDARIFALVQRLGGAERDQAKKDLLLVGDRAVPALAEALRSREVGIVDGAANVLAELGTPAAYAALAAGFSDPGVAFPIALLSALPKVREGGLPVYEAAFRAVDPAGQVQVMRDFASNATLWLHADPEAVADLLKSGLALGNEDVTTLALSLFARGFGESRPIGVALGEDTWVSLLESTDREVVVAAARALMQDALDPVWNEDVAAAKVDAALRMARGELGPAHPSVLSALGGPEKLAVPREGLLDLLAAAGGKGSVLDERLATSVRSRIAELFRRATDGDPSARDEIVRAGWEKLGDAAGRREWVSYWYGQPSPPDPVVAFAATEDPDPSVRATAYSALNGPELAAPEAPKGAFPHIVEDVRASDPNLAVPALYLAGRYHLPVPATAILDALRGASQESVRTAASWALLQLVGPGAKDDLRAMLATDDWALARGPLVKLLGVDAVPDLVALARRLGNGHKPVFEAPGGTWRPAVPTPVLRAYVDRVPEDLLGSWFLENTVRFLRPDQVETLVLDFLSSEDPSRQATAAGVAGRCHLESAYPRLLSLMDSPNESVQIQAQKALEQIRSYLELKASFTRYGEGGKEKVLADARKLLASDDPVKRKGGALAIGALGDPAGIPDLMKLLSDSDESVRQAALSALERLGGGPPPKEEPKPGTEGE